MQDLPELLHPIPKDAESSGRVRKCSAASARDRRPNRSRSKPHSCQELGKIERAGLGFGTGRALTLTHQADQFRPFRVRPPGMLSSPTSPPASAVSRPTADAVALALVT